MTDLIALARESGAVPYIGEPDTVMVTESVLRAFAARLAKAPEDEPTQAMIYRGGNEINAHVVQALAQEELHPDDLALRIYKAMRSASLPPAHQAGGEGWISVDERLPSPFQSVALIHETRFEATGGDGEMNVRACGYLSSWGGAEYWSIRGERATEIKAFTHWMALPKGPSRECT